MLLVSMAASISKIGWAIEMVRGGMVALILEPLNEEAKRQSCEKVGLPKYFWEVIYFVVMWQLNVKLISYVICQSLLYPNIYR